MGETTTILFEVFIDTIGYWWVIIPTIFLGLIVGGIPGFSAANTIIILMPLTLAMDLQTGLVFMVTLYCAARMGAGIPAILVNIPGTAGAAATPLDGYPMAKAGKGQQALAISFVSSSIGGLLTTLIALATMPLLARVGFYMHSVEMIVVMLFGISLIASIASQDMLKGLIAGFLGLMIGSIGTDVVYATPRGTFGFLELYDGVPLIPALVGLFAVSEAFIIIEKRVIVSHEGDVKTGSWHDTFEGVRIALRHWWHIVWTSVIGLIIGVIPGAGASIASFVAYQQSRSLSKTPELYGTGHPQGLIAPESANNGVTSGTLVPLLVLGIPGGATAAIMLVVMQYHGVSFGPSLFETQPEIGYGMFMAMAVAYLLMFLTILPLSRYMSHVTTIPTIYLAPMIISFTLVGGFVPREYMFDMYLALGFGLLGYIARRTGYHVAAILIGVILGPLLERYFLLALKKSDGDIMTLFSSKLGNVLWVALFFSLVLPAVFDWRRKRRELMGQQRKLVG
ncbi:tripartite tricarboxylate transporter permease [Candidatus Halocynthiibacter alkanivorans]|jgi:putative tricarboxylic transport membrane protein|uniref:tripartite tricarboxylate transporter permease n=1 Tax=Candidatus Halocynthiibacter alkanivorans TaxID=2267619 RepID=UPI000DF33F3E|nr:tripartite tricarboxylate transporter permease [Candidatus Halocynthiibacter alkanivorans]